MRQNFRNIRTIALIGLIFALTTIISISNPPNIYADEISYPFKSCSAQPTTPAPGEKVSLQVETYQPVQLEGVIIIKNGQSNTIYYPKEPNKITTRQIDLGSFNNPGVYKVTFQVAGAPGSICKLEAAFTITTNSNLKLEAPQSPITTKITSLALLTISGLIDGKIYNVKLQNWKGGDLADHTRPNPNDWEAFGGRIIATNICNNGQASRSDCTETFGDQLYGLNIYEKNGSYVGSLSFEVKAGTTSTSGQNPCGPEGKECPTALGNIPTNPKAFAEKVLQIGYGLGGGIAFILMVIGSIRVLTSSGEQQKLSGGRDMIVAAVAGLLFIIFSVLILQFIGIEIIGLSP